MMDLNAAINMEQKIMASAQRSAKELLNSTDDFINESLAKPQMTYRPHCKMSWQFHDSGDERSEQVINMVSTHLHPYLNYLQKRDRCNK